MKHNKELLRAAAYLPKGHFIRVFLRVGGSDTPIHSVPTGSALRWTAKGADLGDGYADIRLRRGNELVDLVGPLPLSKVVQGTTEELPRLSPGDYFIELKGYRLADNGRKVPVVTDEWPFRVGEPGTAVTFAEDDGHKSFPGFEPSAP
jgi:hypothetical protein